MSERSAVRGFIEGLLSRKGDRGGFSDSDSLLASGRFDSVDILDVVVYLEQEFGLSFDERFDQDDIDSVDRIVELIGSANRNAGGTR